MKIIRAFRSGFFNWFYKSSKNKSRDLIRLTFVVFILFGINVFMIFNLSGMLTRYTKLINETGKIRGGVQRLAKLKLAGIYDEEAIKSIDFQIKKAKKLNTQCILTAENSREFTRLLNYLEESWALLKEELTKHRENKTEYKEFLEESEKLWHITNDFVLNTEKSSHTTISIYYLLAFSGLFGIISLLFVLFVLKHYVKDKIEFLAEHDQLTGLKNRYYFSEALERTFQLAKRKEENLKQDNLFTIFMCDIDHFKRINDNFGHAIGDKVLKEIALSIKENCRSSDTLARFGGEEFIILSCEEYKNQEEDSMAFAERIRKKIEKLDTIENYRLSISIGISFYKKGKNLDQILKEADLALYQAKDEGRNRCKIYRSDHKTP